MVSRWVVFFTMRLIVLALTTLPLTGIACLNQGPCTLQADPSVRVRVQDSISGAPIASGARMIQRNGTYVDSAEVRPNDPYVDAFPLYVFSALERPGIYAITVRKAGYRDWSRNAVIVREDNCGHPQTVSLTARLQIS